MKERRLAREAAYSWAEEQARLEVERRRARKEAARPDRARGEAKVIRLREARERAQREQQAQTRHEREFRQRAQRHQRARQQRLAKAGHEQIPYTKPATEQPALTGADLAAWRKCHGLNQQTTAQRLGVAQGTISKAERKGTKLLGPALQRALAGEGRSDRNIRSIPWNNAEYSVERLLRKPVMARVHHDAQG